MSIFSHCVVRSRCSASAERTGQKMLGWYSWDEPGFGDGGGRESPSCSQRQPSFISAPPPPPGITALLLTNTRRCRAHASPTAPFCSGPHTTNTVLCFRDSEGRGNA